MKESSAAYRQRLAIHWHYIKDGEGMPTEREWLEGLHGPLAEKPDGDIHDYSDHLDYPSGSNSASVVIPWEDLLGGRDA